MGILTVSGIRISSMGISSSILSSISSSISSIAGVCDLRGSCVGNRGSNWGRGGNGVHVGSGSDFSMHVGSGSDFSVNISLRGNLSMDIGDSSDISMNVFLSGNIFMNIRDSLNIFMNVGLGSNLGVEIRFSEGVDLAGIVVRVDYVVECRGDGKRGGGNSGDVSVSSSVRSGSVS